MRFLDEKAQKTVWMLESLIVKDSVYPDGFKMKRCEAKTNNIIPEIDDTWEDLKEFVEFNEWDIHFWIRGTIKTPKAYDGLYYAVDFKQEYSGVIHTIIYLNGEMTQGLDANHTRTVLEPDTTYDVAFYCYVSPVYSPRKHVISTTMPKLVTICQKTETLYFDFSTPFQASEAIDKTSDDYRIIINHLELAANLIDFREPYSKEYYKSVDEAIKYLADEFYGKECGQSDITVNCLGHSHIDIAWRWPVRQTVEKVQRSFSTVLYLMEHYPEYIFMMTSPQMYEFMKDQAPEQYEKIKQKVKEGKWEVDGAMWLEADGNLPSGESFIRQVIYGKKFFKDEFGVNSRTLWIPDVFGYSAALPQILKKSGVDRFVTGKISWNDTDRMPNDTFYWKGIDGSEVFTQFLTSQDFVNPDKSRIFVMLNGMLDAREVKSTWDIYRNKEYNDQTIHTFGYGDGGGGPTYQMLERQRRFAKGIPGIPKTKMNTLDNYLNKSKENFDKACEKYGRTPRWSGELYLQYHRGTYTSVAKTKKANRECEFILAKTEALSVFDMLFNNSAYPKDDFDVMWKQMLLNQFHDIIPGSCIKEVSDTAEVGYNMVKATCKDISDKAYSKIISNISSDDGMVVFNHNSFISSDIVETKNGFAYAKDVPAHGYKVFSKLDYTNKATVSQNGISNRYFDIIFNENGDIFSIYDKENDRYVTNGVANEFVAYEDRPKFYDAWELTHYYKQKPYKLEGLVSILPYENGAKKGVTVTRKFMNSSVKQNIIVYDNIRRIDFETEIDWKEDHLILKTLFPINVFTNKVTAEIQMGHVERTTHKNRSWDEAQFEMCMHKWIDISDNSYGVSFINDCKYGYSCDENVVGLTILKCATDPDPEADKCIHNFTYSIYTHENTPCNGKTVQMAYCLNQKMTAIDKISSSGTLPAEFSLVSVNKENIIIETVKKAENDNAVIVRMYDSYNMVTNAKIKFGFDVKKAYTCDLNENVLEELEVTDNSVTTKIKNFEIVTLKLEI
ncbi:MAG: alpha-mannosidase [Clostridia bacterium]|nr:alpha-mannosidase [Clostridia bacterium]